MAWRFHKIWFAALAALCAWYSPAQAINGGAPASSELAAQTVMIVSTRGSICTGTVIARDLVLTAAHCVAPKSNYAVSVTGGAPRVIQVARIVLHPKFDPRQFETRVPSPDMAIIKLAEPLPANYRAATLMRDPVLPKRGTLFTLAGFGFAKDGDERSLGTLRSIALPSVGTTGGIMVRVSNGNGGTQGACTGDSGGPAYLNGELAGVIGWTSIPTGKNCGFTTGVTLVGLQLGWIQQTARSFSTRIE
ncbi:MAG TPA: trypsin-like serine protease [Xanthobacteraceae bacterium]|nr:trypsin-like serine protease [Xanthobacteraceae bacterium]